MAIDIKAGTKLKTHGGRNVTVIYVFPAGTTDDHGDAIVGILHCTDGDKDEVCGWKLDGTFFNGKHPRLSLDLKAAAPPFEVIINTTPITLTQQGRDSFTVTYGKQIDQHLRYGDAADKLGCAILHALACDSLIDNREQGE